MRLPWLRTYKQVKATNLKPSFKTLNCIFLFAIQSIRRKLLRLKIVKLKLNGKITAINVFLWWVDQISLGIFHPPLWLAKQFIIIRFLIDSKWKEFPKGSVRCAPLQCHSQVCERLWSMFWTFYLWSHLHRYLTTLELFGGWGLPHKNMIFYHKREIAKFMKWDVRSF